LRGAFHRGTHPAETSGMKLLLGCIAVLTLVAIALVARAIKSAAGMPSLDDPKDITPPPARDLDDRP